VCGSSISRTSSPFGIAVADASSPDESTVHGAAADEAAQEPAAVRARADSTIAAAIATARSPVLHARIIASPLFQFFRFLLKISGSCY
jgi:hypothetical protein